MVLDRRELLAMSEVIAEDYYRMSSESMDAADHTRLMQLLLGVEAILRKRSENGTHQEYVKCVKIYFRAAPWPFISSDEIRFVLDKFGCEKPLFVESMCRDFNDLFPEFHRTQFAPRSLKELCRVELRENLTYRNEQRTSTLPVVVSALCIPHTLKDYLLGEEW